MSQFANVSAISSANGHTVALRMDGTVWCTGRNSSGRLGDGTLTGRAAARPVANVSGVVRLASGHAARHFLAELGDGTIVAWGSYTTGTPIPSDTPGTAWHPLSEGVSLL